ncbi:MAG: hypothetical protein BMS9Abin26_0770 [Gammaproteobacteria bacterium]|nr:MAG: hypothetical protein BMS9Abin26_0770 [Gammaproteobacteria bacterium]
MKYPAIIPTTLLILLTSLTYGPALAEPSSAKGPHEMMQGKQSKQQNSASSRSGQHEPRWKKALSDEQRARLQALMLDHMKNKFPLKAKKKALKIDLALLVMTDKPNEKTIDKKINELLAVKKQMMKLKYAHKITVRKALTPEQRVLFDMHILKKSMRGKHRKHSH